MVCVSDDVGEELEEAVLAVEVATDVVVCWGLGWHSNEHNSHIVHKSENSRGSLSRHCGRQTGSGRRGGRYSR